MTFEDGKKVIRKSIDRQSEREYGFVRWYSQMKRLQRYNQLFPELFPRLLNVGALDGAAYFDIEYFAEARDVKHLLIAEEPPEQMIIKLHESLWQAMERMHSQTLATPKNSIPLYFVEEVEQKLADAMKHENFRRFVEQDTLYYNDQECMSLARNMDWYREAFTACKVNSECWTHGNITLENVIYDPQADRIIFIDPYDENILDCRENEYSQILQCSKNYYGLINDGEVRIEENRAYFDQEVPQPLVLFDKLFRARLNLGFSDEFRRGIEMFEISQFVRMLPFKVATNDVEKAKYFYTLASNLLTNLKHA